MAKAGAKAASAYTAWQPRPARVAARREVLRRMVAERHAPRRPRERGYGVAARGRAEWPRSEDHLGNGIRGTHRQARPRQLPGIRRGARGLLPATGRRGQGAPGARSTGEADWSLTSGFCTELFESRSNEWNVNLIRFWSRYSRTNSRPSTRRWRSPSIEPGVRRWSRWAISPPPYATGRVELSVKARRPSRSASSWWCWKACSRSSATH